MGPGGPPGPVLPPRTHRRALLSRQPVLGIVLSALAGAVTAIQGPSATWPSILEPSENLALLDAFRVFLVATGVFVILATVLVWVRPRLHGGIGATVLLLCAVSLGVAGDAWMGPLLGIVGGILLILWSVPVTRKFEGSRTCRACGRTVTGAAVRCPYCDTPTHPAGWLAWQFSYRRGGQG